MNILETPSIQETISRIFMNETENVAQLEGLERFFEVETQLMHEIHNLEKDRAKETLRELIDMLALSSMTKSSAICRWRKSPSTSIFRQATCRAFSVNTQGLHWWNT